MGFMKERSKFQGIEENLFPRKSETDTQDVPLLFYVLHSDSFGKRGIFFLPRRIKKRKRIEYTNDRLG